MRRFDFIIIGAVLILAACVFLIFSPPAENPARVYVVSDGTEIPIDLPDEPIEIELENRHGRNTLRLTRHGAEVIYADCPTLICVRTGKITNSRQVIACLPHYLIITLSSTNFPSNNDRDSAGAHDVDAIVR